MMRITTATTAPCPAWCIYGAFHDFAPEQDRAGIWRRHDHPVRWLQWSHVDGRTPAVSLWMSQVEHAAVMGGPVHSRPVEVIMDSSAHSRLTGPQARQLAAALTDAADLWDAAQTWGSQVAGV